MSAMQFNCPFCSGLFEVDAELAGQQVTCPSCAGVVLVPAASMADMPPPPPSDMMPPSGLPLPPNDVPPDLFRRDTPTPPEFATPPPAPPTINFAMPPAPLRIDGRVAPPPPPEVRPRNDHLPPTIDEPPPPPALLPPTLPTPPEAPLSVPVTGLLKPRPVPVEAARSKPETKQLDLDEVAARPATAPRYITPEERAHRRMLRNVIWGFLGLVVLVIMAVILRRAQ